MASTIEFVIIIIILALLVAIWRRYQFNKHLTNLTSAISNSSNNTGKKIALPPEVLSFSKALGAELDCSYTHVILKQSGKMWSEPNSRPLPFEAQQTISITGSEFIWNARFSPFDYIIVADYVTENSAGLDACLFGVIPLVKHISEKDARKGELLRYLAEIPLAPDAIMFNSALDWNAIDAHNIVVGLGKGTMRTEVALQLNNAGLVTSMLAKSRGAQIDDKIIDRPWGGNFRNYKKFQGRNIPTEAEVYWVIDGKKFVYWRAKITDWHLTK